LISSGGQWSEAFSVLGRTRTNDYTLDQELAGDAMKEPADAFCFVSTFLRVYQ